MVGLNPVAAKAAHGQPEQSETAAPGPPSQVLVRSRGLEPPRVAPLAPQASASTNSATTAWESGFARLSRRALRCNKSILYPQGRTAPPRPKGIALNEPSSRQAPLPSPRRATVDWHTSARPVAYADALAAMETRVAEIAAGDKPGAGVAAGAPAALYRGHQRGAGRADRSALSGVRDWPRRPLHLSRSRPAGRLCDARSQAARRRSPPLRVRRWKNG